MLAAQVLGIWYRDQSNIGRVEVLFGRSRLALSRITLAHKRSVDFVGDGRAFGRVRGERLYRPVRAEDHRQ